MKILESHDWLARLRNVGFPYVALESTQNHSPGLYSAHTVFTFEWEITRDLHT